MSAVARSSAGRTREATEGFRADVEGLRAVAVTLVVAFHARHSLVPGGYIGVDVFFVLSGFLITGLLLREFEQHGRVSLSRFWARRIRRLLPLSSLVLICTLAGTWLIIAPINRGVVAASARAAALYQANWHFASQANDYFAGLRGDRPGAALLVAQPRGAVLRGVAADPDRCWRSSRCGSDRFGDDPARRRPCCWE